MVRINQLVDYLIFFVYPTASIEGTVMSQDRMRVSLVIPRLVFSNKELCAPNKA